MVKVAGRYSQKLNFSPVASYGGFCLHSVSVFAEQIPPALSSPRGNRQMYIQACTAGLLLRRNKMQDAEKAEKHNSHFGKMLFGF